MNAFRARGVRRALLAFSLGLAACAGRVGGHDGHGTEPRDAQDSHGTEPDATPLPGHVYGERATSIHVTPTDRFSVALPVSGNPKLRWQLDPQHDQSVARLVEEGRWDAAPASCQGCGTRPGALHYFHFEATGIGPTDARFRLKDPDALQQAHEREFVIRLRVEMPQD